MRVWLTAIPLFWLATLAQAAAVESFSPTGEQLEIGQVRARFSTPMAPLGRADAPAPFAIDCPLAGEGRWADERTWVYDLQGQPQAGTACRFRIREGLKSVAGEAVEAGGDYRFSIAGPRVLASLPGADTTVDEEQVFVLRLNGPLRADSLAGRVRCEAQGIHERIPVRRLTGAERAGILEQVRPQVADLVENWDAGYRPEADGSLEVLRCARALPAKAKLFLVWGEGVATPSGARNPSEQRLLFRVRDEFVARVRCDRENARAGCIPLTPIRVEFSAQVARAWLDAIRLRDDTGKTYPQTAAEPAAAFDTGVRFAGPFPADANLELVLPKGIGDDKGRPLDNAGRFPMAVRVGRMPPLVKFAGDFGIVESKEGGLLPLTVRNLEPGKDGTAARVRWLRLTDDAAILDWMARVKKAAVPHGKPLSDPRRERLLTARLPGLVDRPLPKPEGAQAFEVVGVPLGEPGYYVVEAESRRLGQALIGADTPMYVRAGALVTNLAVHFKWGAADSLAWVTRLDQGTPVQGAQVAVRDCKGRQLAAGGTDSDGLARFPKGIPDPRGASWDCPLFVSARAGGDLAFALSDWDEGIETWRFGLPSDWQRDNRLAHTVLDRTLFRPGETVHMQHLLRARVPAGLALPARTPRTLLIEHGDSAQRWFLPLQWKDGAAAVDWAIPKTAKRGEYSLRLLDEAIAPDSEAARRDWFEGLDSGRFTVADFRVPLMRASLDPVDKRLVAANAAAFDTAVSWQNGGGARGLPVKLRAQLEPAREVEFAGYEDYDFARRKDTDSGQEEDETVALAGDEFRLDAGGAGRGRVSGLPALAMPHRLRVELEYADPNGEIQTVSRAAPWWPAAVVLGMKRDGWARRGQATTLVFQALDLDGRPAAGIPVNVRLALRQSFGHRVRLAGGFYGYRHESRETPLPGRCDGHTDEGGRFTCQARAEQGGEVRVSAEARDAQGRVARSHHSYWVAGRDEWGFAQDNHDRIDLVAEKKRYEPGETARLQVRMPYRLATALITVERDGILDARVVKLRGKDPVVEVPIADAHAPNVYVSALVVRGRTPYLQPGALADLGRPAFKLGITGIQVGRGGHALEVKVSADRELYQIREKARVKVRVRTPDGKAPPAGTRVALAAVDEGLLELAPNGSWDVLGAMMAERGYNLRNFTAQMQVTGKRHYGRKALPQGGGGGRLPTRELFDTLLYWNADVVLDAHGQASVEVPLNDSLTAFRIAAVASSATRFGDGATRIRASQDLQLVSGLAPVVRQGDRTQARFTVRNGSTRPMRVEVSARADADVGRLAGQTVELAPGEGKEAAWPVRVPEMADSLAWQVEARELSGRTTDALKVSQQVDPAVPVRVQSATLFRLEGGRDLPVAPPAGALAGRGEVRATLAASLADGQTGVRAWLRDYPLACLEQKASKAIGTRDENAWQALGEALPGYLADNGLADYFPGAGGGSVALTAYLLSISAEAGWPLPAAPRAGMERALAEWLAGRLETPLPYGAGAEAPIALRVAALEALARQGKATPGLLATIKPEPNLWPTATVIDWIGALRHLSGVADRDELLKQAQEALRARLYLTGKRLTIQDEGRAGRWWLMASADTLAAKGLAAVLELPGWRDDIDRLAAGALLRQSNGHWDTTTANAWGSLAMERYTRLREAVKPGGRSTVILGRQGRLVDWEKFPRGATAFLPLPDAPDTLKLRHEGPGAPVVSVSTLAAVPLTAPVNRGYRVNREVLPVEQKNPGRYSRGDVLRVRLKVDAAADMGWVVVEDPLPPGASILGTGLGREGRNQSAILSAGEQTQGAWPAWQERLFQTYRAYYAWVPKGGFGLEYTLRLNSDGDFQLPPTRVEAMYAPEMSSEAPVGRFRVEN
ncbi:MAG TPA: MG2 domain-containing protein [Thiobacillaceae bacterium]|nr:MG2 domain-containing protein [Thiobacillaceae bacterium]